MTIITCPQRSPEWFAARLGRVTSSRVDAVFMSGKKKGEESSTRAAYRLELALERLTGQSAASDYVNADMQRGIELEDAAISAVEARLGLLFDRVGFIQHDELMVGTSPDAVLFKYCNVEMVVEVKCPRPTTHLAYLRNPESLVATYAAQLRHHLWVSGARSWAIASFCPAFPRDTRLLIVRGADLLLNTDDSHELAVRLFLNEVDAEVEAIKALGVCA